MQTSPTSRHGRGLAQPVARLFRRRSRWMGSAAGLALMLLAPHQTARAQAPVSRYDTADVQFMQGMIAHHAQALAMVALIPTHTRRPELQMIGERIKISQTDEIALMQRWLTDHHDVVPTVDADNVAHMPGADMPGMHMSGGMMMMPGMLTPEQMKQLADAKDTQFDTLFLVGMIHHHEGALAMVKSLLGTAGAAQGPDVFTFAADADADQRAEIKRMQGVLATINTQSHKS
jgi:uncharacterized protein (DUF305 family)